MFGPLGIPEIVILLVVILGFAFWIRMMGWAGGLWPGGRETER